MLFGGFDAGILREDDKSSGMIAFLAASHSLIQVFKLDAPACISIFPQFHDLNHPSPFAHLVLPEECLVAEIKEIILHGV